MGGNWINNELDIHLIDNEEKNKMVPRFVGKLENPA